MPFETDYNNSTRRKLCFETVRTCDDILETSRLKYIIWTVPLFAPTTQQRFSNFHNSTPRKSLIPQQRFNRMNIHLERNNKPHLRNAPPKQPTNPIFHAGIDTRLADIYAKAFATLPGSFSSVPDINSRTGADPLRGLSPRPHPGRVSIVTVIDVALSSCFPSAPSIREGRGHNTKPAPRNLWPPGQTESVYPLMPPPRVCVRGCKYVCAMFMCCKMDVYFAFFVPLPPESDVLFGFLCCSFFRRAKNNMCN